MNSNKSFKQKFLSFIISLLVITAVGFAVGVVISGFIEYNELTFDPVLLTNSTTLTVVGLVVLSSLLYFLTNIAGRDEDEAGVSADGTKKYFDTHWLTEKELKKNPAFKYHTFSTLKTSTNVGIPIRAEYSKGQLHINMYKSIHTLVIGTTGSGKTTQFVDPMIQILGESKAKPSMVITDPKGELFDNHSKKLREAGYDIMVFDLKEPFKSTRWNPLTRAYDLNHRALNLEKEVMVHRGDNPKQYKHLKIASKEKFSKEWYEFDGYAFTDLNVLKNHMTSLRQQLKTDAMEELSDIAEVLSPIESTSDPTWERGAKEFLYGTMIAMLEDSENPELGMTREKFNFYNLAKIVNIRDAGKNPFATISEYFEGRDKLSLAVQLTNQVLKNADGTAKSYMGIVSERVALFNDLGVCYATSMNDMNLDNFADKPTALFIKIPDERTSRHGIASMFISQLYKILVSAANKTGGQLPREVHFILDEFANMPAISRFETIITVARGRRIFFTLILQSYSQLSIKYKEDVAVTVKDNCNIHIFIASNDQNTLKEFSERCGNITVRTRNTSVSKGEKDSTNRSYSVQEDTRPLIYPAELGTLKDQMIVSILKQPPIKAVFTPSYYKTARKFYKMDLAEEEYIEPSILDEHALLYDVEKRNKIILSQEEDDDFSGFNFI